MQVKKWWKSNDTKEELPLGMGVLRVVINVWEVKG